MIDLRPDFVQRDRFISCKTPSGAGGRAADGNGTKHSDAKDYIDGHKVNGNLQFLDPPINHLNTKVIQGLYKGCWRNKATDHSKSTTSGSHDEFKQNADGLATWDYVYDES